MCHRFHFYACPGSLKGKTFKKWGAQLIEENCADVYGKDHGYWK